MPTPLPRSLLSITAALLLAGSAWAAPPQPKPISTDRSTGALIDPAMAEKVWEEALPARVMRLYPKRRFRFVSEVAGGFNEDKSCVVTARAMVLPLQGTRIVYAPVRSATTFDAAPSLTRDPCRDLARNKLKEAVEAIAASIVAS